MKIGIQTASEQTYRELRRQIISGVLAPSQPLPLLEVAQELGVSTTPVRAAISRLQANGLVVQERHRAAIVAPLDMADVEVIQAVRAGIEGRAARLGAPKLGDESIEEMSSVLETLPTIASISVDDYLLANWRLHDLCYIAADQSRLLEQIRSYQRRAERYIRLVVGDDVGFQESLVQQAEFVEACRRRDGEKAQTVMRCALEYTVDRLDEFFRGRAA
jgi:DNA-binding GntR family transcriptional regulator